MLLVSSFCALAPWFMAVVCYVLGRASKSKRDRDVMMSLTVTAVFAGTLATNFLPRQFYLGGLLRAGSASESRRLPVRCMPRWRPSCGCSTGWFSPEYFASLSQPQPLLLLQLDDAGRNGGRVSFRRPVHYADLLRDHVADQLRVGRAGGNGRCAARRQRPIWLWR